HGSCFILRGKITPNGRNSKKTRTEEFQKKATLETWYRKRKSTLNCSMATQHPAWLLKMHRSKNLSSKRLIAIPIAQSLN
ncbi:MAG: hypothetical protein ACO3B0_07665, partial [Chitinophagaceae bacterium]